jgi:hypothetical protein
MEDHSRSYERGGEEAVVVSFVVAKTRQCF